MTDKEMIEEMAKRLASWCEYGDFGYTNVVGLGELEFAKELLKYYQPKIPEGSVVLSKEEYAELKQAKSLLEFREETIKYLEDANIRYAKALELKVNEKERKETARAFWYMAVTQIKDTVNPSPDNKNDLFAEGVNLARRRVLRILNEIAKRFDVEVEEC